MGCWKTRRDIWECYLSGHGSIGIQPLKRFVKMWGLGSEWERTGEHTAAEVLSRAKNVTGGGAFRGIISAVATVRAAPALSLNHGTKVSRIATSSALAASLTRHATRGPLATGRTGRTASGAIAVITEFAASYP